MNYSKFDFKFVIILVLAVLLAILMFKLDTFEHENSELIKVNGKQYQLLSRKVDTLIVTKDTTIYKDGRTIYIDREIKVPVYIPAEVDTMEILQDYFTKRYYVDTLSVEDYGQVIVKDTLFQNRILTRQYDASFNQKIITETIIVKTLPKPHLYYGGGIGIDKQNIINNIHTGLLLRTKSNSIYGVEGGIANYGLDNSIIPFVNFKMYRKIGK